MVADEASSVLIVDDDAITAGVITEFLQQNRMTTEWVTDGVQGLSLAVRNHYDLIVAGSHLPLLDGVALCKKLRQEAGVQTPLMILADEPSTESSVASFNAGADGFMVKPFSCRELLARAHAIMRRPRLKAAAGYLTVGDLSLNTTTERVTRAGREIELGQKPLALLAFMMQHHPRALERIELTQLLWGKGDMCRYSNALRQHIHALRKAVDEPFDHAMIRNVPGRRICLVAMD